MEEQTFFDYYYGGESEQFAFYRIPRQLVTGSYFKNLSTDAKLLYGLLLDRMSLSMKNGWYDEQGRVYIYYPLDEIQEALCCSHGKAVRLFAELDTGRGIGLIERIRQGQGKPARIYVHLYDESTGDCACGCGNPDCACDGDCNGDCCSDDSCGDNHNWVLLDSVDASCLTLGYDRYICVDCGRTEKRDYTAQLGHAYQSIVIRDATCETDGKVLEICERCGDVKETSTPKGEHEYKTYSVSATCTSPGYTVRECAICGDRHIEDITSALAHDYIAKVTAATCEAGGHRRDVLRHKSVV